MFVKQGELNSICEHDIQSHDSVVAQLSSEEINDRFAKFAAQLKRVAPKSNEFLYFVSPIITAAEASALNKDGSPKKTRTGEPIVASFEGEGENIKWTSNDPLLRPYKNNNGDIFPEREIIAAHKKWIGCPLLIDHNNSVASVRGIILDVYYDRKVKQAIALVALDKVSYPELARSVATRMSMDTSMGTSVKIAKCFDCGRAARTADQFCSHMRAHSGYGEINIGLEPLELSIVNRAACPNAKIRTVFAAAQELRNELDQKSHELISSNNVSKLADLQSDFENLSTKFIALKEAMNESQTDENNITDSAPYGNSSGQYDPPQDELEQNSLKLNIPERLAYDNSAFIGELKTLKASIEDRLSSLEKTLQTKIEELNMATDKTNNGTSTKQAYWQGGGGVNEPTPGKPKYPADPLNEELRLKEDRQMVGQPPFPGVGNVDGLHPSPSSAEPKDELERKKMLARAELEERSMRRQAAVQKAKENIMTTKEAYFQGGGGVNEPTPGKPKYEKDPLNEHDREKEDRQMVGQSPFPGVGNVDGLHPSPASVEQKDELERKKLLQRASLKARFVRAANADGTENLGNSGWHVYAKDDSGEKLVFTASVNELTGGRSDALFDAIATKEYGSKMLEKIRSVGLAKAASLLKNAQAVAGPGAMPGAPPDATGNAPVPALPGPEMMPDTSSDKGGKGDPKDAAMKLAEEARDVTSDLLEVIRDLTGEKTEMGDMEEGLNALPKAAAEQLIPLGKMRADLNNQLLSGMKKSVAELNDHQEELKLVVDILDNGSTNDKNYTSTVVSDVIVDAKSAVADAHSLMRIYTKYARGTANLLKRAAAAEEEAEKSSDMSNASDMMTDENAVMEMGDKNNHFGMEDDMMDVAPDSEHEHDGHDPMMEKPECHECECEGCENCGSDAETPAGTEDMNNVMVDVDPNSLAGKKVEIKSAGFDLTTKEGRSAYRAKIANDATGKEDTGEIESVESIKFAPVMHDANSLANGQTKLDVMPSDQLGLVETKPEHQKKMLEVARAAPKVRQAAERLNQLIVEGKVATSDLDALVKEGLDSEVVKYWRSFWGQAGKEGSEFARMLTTENAQAKQAEEMKAFQVKIARAYEVTYEMVRRGMLADERGAINSYVGEVMKWNDEAFDSMKRVIAKHAPLSIRKEAGSMPQFGQFGSNEDVAPQAKELDFQGELDRAFAGRKY